MQGEGRGERGRYPIFSTKAIKKALVLCFFVQKAHKNILHDLFQDPDTFELRGGTLIHGCCAVFSVCMFF